MEQKYLPKDFVTFEEAIKLIESDKRDNPVVDTSFLVNNIPYIRERGNYNIKLLKYDENGKIVDNGNRYVRLENEWECITLKKVITDHYEKVSKNHTKVDYNEIGLNSFTTAIDDKKNPGGKPIVNDEPLTQYGDPTTGGTREVTEE